MDPTFLIGGAGALFSTISAMYSVLKILRKQKAEKSFISELKTDLDENQRQSLLLQIKESSKYLLDYDKKNLANKGLNRLQNIDNFNKQIKLQEEIILELEKVLDKLRTEDKSLIEEAINQPSRKGRSDYLLKLLEETKRETSAG